MRFAVARASTLTFSRVAQPSGLDDRGEDDYSIKAGGEGLVSEALSVDYSLPYPPARTSGPPYGLRGPLYYGH